MSKYRVFPHESTGFKPSKILTKSELNLLLKTLDNMGYKKSQFEIKEVKQK